MSFKQKFIGDRKFYSYALGIAVPMIVQNIFTNFVSMLDNIMVGQIGTAQMSGVSIVNQFMFVFNLTIFGGLAGPGIFGTQFFGSGNHTGQKYTFRFRLMLAAAIITSGALILHCWGTELISLFISKDDSPELIEATLLYGCQYLNIMLLSLIPFGIGQAYSSVVRECGETKIPMYGSISAIGVNLLLDYGLIFGKLGMPRMGVQGAAIATVIAKFIEALVVVIWAHTHKEKNQYIVGLFKSARIPLNLAGKMVVKSAPLLLNELLWSVGMSVIAWCYSLRGLDVVAARNISSTITNLFNVFFIQIGGSIGIIVGMKLGAGKLEEAKDTDRKLIFFSVASTTVIGLLMIPFAAVFPKLYNTEEIIKDISSFFILIQGLVMPVCAFNNASYFTIRSGGKTGITFLFDFGFTWFLQIPLAFVIGKYLPINIYWMFTIVSFAEIFKAIIGFIMVKSNVWVNNLVAEEVVA